jgi:hypothetical protein
MSYRGETPIHWMAPAAALIEHHAKPGEVEATVKVIVASDGEPARYQAEALQRALDDLPPNLRARVVEVRIILP